MASATIGQQEMAPVPNLARVLEVAKYLAMSRSKVYAMMDAGELAYVKLGKSRRVPWDAVHRLVASNMVDRQV
jgi:excisionase family DNA binding protein